MADAIKTQHQSASQQRKDWPSTLPSPGKKVLRENAGRKTSNVVSCWAICSGVVGEEHGRTSYSHQKMLRRSSTSSYAGTKYWCFVVQWYMRRGYRGCKRTRKKFWFVENLGQIHENPGKTQIPMQKWRPMFDFYSPKPKKSTWRINYYFLKVTSKKGLDDLCERKFVGISRTKTFRASLGKFWKKSFAPPKIACSFTYVYCQFSGIF